MSDSEGLYKIYGRYATKINPDLISEAIENAIPEEPLLLSDSDIDFLRQFDEEYWAQALYKRNEKLFRYLVNLDNLRKKVRNAAYEAELEEIKNKFEDPIFAKMNPFVKKRQIKAQAESAAKAIATKLLPAGRKINPNILNEPSFRKLKKPVKSALMKNIRNINNYYLSKESKFDDLKSGRSAPETILADPKIGELARNIEGSYGSKVGHDLHNPRILQRKKIDHQAMKDELKRLQDIAKQKKKPLPTMADVLEMHKDLEPKFVTDGFVFPSYTEIQSAIRDKIKAVRSGLSVPTDAVDQARLDVLHQTLGRGQRPTADVGVHPTEKQLLAQMEYTIKSELNAENLARRAKGLKEIDKPANKIRDEAKQRIRKDLTNYMPENFKNHLKSLGFSEKQAASAKNPYGDTNIVLGAEGLGGDSRLIKQNPTYKNDIAYPHMSGKVRKAIKGLRMEPEKKILPALFKSGFYRDVKLQYPHDSAIDLDTTVTNLVPGNELGEKFFDKELFERLVKRINFLKKNPTAPEAPAVEAILKRFKLNTNSDPQEVIDAAHRNFYQKADKKDYKQGGDVSSTWSHHPTRLSAKLDFFNRYHDKAKYDQVVSALLDKGVKRTKNAPPISLFDFIAQDVTNKLDIKASDTEELPKLVMQRVKDTIVGLVQLRVFESLGNPEILKWYGIGKAPFSCFDNPSSPSCFGNGAFIGEIVNKEIKRIKDQDLFTGSVRKRAQLAGSEDDPAHLTCKQGERGYQTGRCVYGADLRTINDYFNLGSKKLDKLGKLGEEASAGDDEESITEERKKIRLVLEGLNEMNEAILVLLTSLNIAKTPGISEQDARVNAKHELTDFLKAHIKEDYPEFIKNLYTFYKQSFQTLKSMKPKDAASLKIPAMIRHRRENRPTTKHFFSKRFDAAAKGKDLLSSDEYQNAIASSDINRLNKIYNTTLTHDPSMADKVYEGILDKLEDPATKEEFIAKNGDTNKKVKETITAVNNPKFARLGLASPYLFLGPYIDTEKYPPHQWGPFYRQYIPYLSDKNLLWLSRFLVENINYIPDLEPDATPEEREQGKKNEENLKQYLPMRDYLINYIHQQIKKRNLMTSLIARMNDPETLEQFEKSSQKYQKDLANLNKLRTKYDTLRPK